MTNCVTKYRAHSCTSFSSTSVRCEHEDFLFTIICSQWRSAVVVVVEVAVVVVEVVVVVAFVVVPPSTCGY